MRAWRYAFPNARPVTDLRISEVALQVRRRGAGANARGPDAERSPSLAVGPEVVDAWRADHRIELVFLFEKVRQGSTRHSRIHVLINCIRACEIWGLHTRRVRGRGLTLCGSLQLLPAIELVLNAYVPPGSPLEEAAQAVADGFCLAFGAFVSDKVPR